LVLFLGLVGLKLLLLVQDLLEEILDLAYGRAQRSHSLRS